MKKCADCGVDKSPKGNYCKPCGYKHRKRPSGLKYNIVAKNRGWYKKGNIPWSKGTKGVIKPNSGSIKKGERKSMKTEFNHENSSGENNIKWKGDNVGYHALHQWVYRHKGRPLVCEVCGGNKKMEWANKSYKYIRDVNDWLSLCNKCHKHRDSKLGWGMATRKYGVL